VLGDFSYGKRFEETNVLLCRETGAMGLDETRVSFRRVGRGDRELRGIVEKHANVLEDCPANLLFED
jgi:hypothetical protein